MAKKKEAIVLLVDISPSAAIEEYDEIDRKTTFIEQAVICIKQVLQRKIFSESKDELALVVFGSETTNNPLAEDDTSYNNISVIQNMTPVTWGFLELLDKKLRPGSTKSDLLDAIVVAFDHMKTALERSKTTSQCIYVFSPLRDDVNDDKSDVIIKALINYGVNLNVIGPPVKDEDSVKEDLKMSAKTKEILRKMVEETNGLWFSFKETMSCIEQILPRVPNPMAWKTNLKIGKLEIPISSYLKVKKHQLKGWKKCYKEDKNAKLMTERSYHKYDEAQTQCDMQDIVERYRYGSSLVIFTEEDKANMQYVSGEKSLQVLGFTKSENVKRHHFVGDGIHYIVADSSKSQNVETSLSALIHALYELGMVGIVRKVYSARSAPIIGFLAPLIKAEYECLIFGQLPFMEDMRLFTFSSLNFDEVTTDEAQAIDELIDTLSPNLSKGDVGLHKKIDNPFNTHIFQCISARILEPDAGLKQPDDKLLNLFKPPKDVLN